MLITAVFIGWFLQGSETHPNDKRADWRAQADSLHQAGLAFSDQGNDSNALLLYEKALTLYNDNGGEPDQLLGLLYNDMAFSYGSIYVPYYSLEYFRKAVEIWESIDLNDEGVDNLISGYQNLLFELVGYGDIKAATEIRKRMNSRFYSHYFKHGRRNTHFPLYTHSRQMQLLGNVRVLSAEGRFEEAYAYIDTIHRELVDQHIELAAYKTLFDDTYHQGDDSLTIRFAKKALSIANAYDNPFYRLVCYAKLASVYHRMGALDQALAHAEQAEQSMSFDSFSASKHAVQSIKAMILAGLNRLGEARDVVEASLSEIIHNQADTTVRLYELQPDDLGDLSSYTFIRVFTENAWILYRCYQRDQRAESLIKAANVYCAAAAMFNRYYLKGEYTDLIDDLHLKITEGLLTLSIDEPGRAADYLNLIERNASQHLIKEFEKKLWMTNKLRPQTSAAFNLHDVLAALKSGESLIKYHVASEHVYRTLISADGAAVARIGCTDSLRQLVFRYAGQLRQLTPGYEELSDSLRQRLFGADSAKITTLVPDNFLNYVPFESLYDARSGRFLGETHTVSYAYSLPLWLLHQKASYPALAAVRMTSFSPAYRGEQLVHERQQLHELRYAREEASRVAELFGGDQFGADDATKQAFLNRLADYDVFHFAMHSFFYEDDFNQSCLVFSGGEKLYFSELYALHIPARMAVLSACNTGNGRLVKGEGIMSLARAFTYAGVASTVVSLWQAPDKETAEIMTLFYAGIAEGLSKSSALARAKRLFLANNPMKRHPYFWAGFVANGDDSPLVSGSRHGVTWTGIGLGLVLVSVVFLWLGYRRRLQLRQ